MRIARVVFAVEGLTSSSSTSIMLAGMLYFKLLLEVGEVVPLIII